MQNVLATSPTGNSAGRYLTENTPPQYCATRAIYALRDWREHSPAGAFARAIWAPYATARAVYGAVVSRAFCRALENIVGGGDLAFIRCYDSGEIFAVMPLANFEAMAEAA